MSFRVATYELLEVRNGAPGITDPGAAHFPDELAKNRRSTGVQTRHVHCLGIILDAAIVLASVTKHVPGFDQRARMVSALDALLLEERQGLVELTLPDERVLPRVVRFVHEARVAGPAKPDPEALCDIPPKRPHACNRQSSDHRCVHRVPTERATHTTHQ